MNPEVSVLISVYNGEQTISRCIESILNQSFDDFELVIINDGSTDTTKVIIKSFKDSRIRHFSPGRLGLAKALNYGLDQCRGKYIGRMDADDWSHPDRLVKQVNFLSCNPEVDVVSSLVEYAGDRGQNEGYALHVDWINQLITHNQMFINRFEDAPVANPSCMFRSHLIEKYENYSEDNIPEDYEFWLRLMDQGVKFGKVEEVLLQWSDLTTRLTRTSANYSQKAFFEVKAHYFKKWLDTQFSTPPKIYVFGTGKSVNQKLKPFSNSGIRVFKFIEVKNLDCYPKNTIHYTQLSHSDGGLLVLSFIGNREGKVKIQAYLESLGYSKGRSYLMMS